MLLTSLISARRHPVDHLIRGLITFELFLVLVYWLDALLGAPFPLFHGLFDLDGEANIPTWFSSAQLLLIALTLLASMFYHRRPERPSKLMLFSVSAVFVLLSADEVVQLHEGITGVLGSRYIDWGPELLNDYKAASLLAVVPVVIVLRKIYPELTAFWNWSRPSSLIAIGGLCTIVLGASVIESVGYKFLEPGSIAYKVEVTIEEFLEMFGASLILHSALSFALGRLESRFNEASRLTSMAVLVGR
jgi:hypothetical protein